MKTTLLILALTIPTFTQQTADERHGKIIALISREAALLIYKGAVIEKSDFVIFTADTQSTEMRGKESITFSPEMFESIGSANEDRAALVRHLKMFIPLVKNTCHEGHSRGMDCTVHFRHIRF